MNIINNNVNKDKFKGDIRNLEERDLIGIQLILEHWVVDSDTGKPLPNEVDEDISLMRESIKVDTERHYFVAVQEAEIIGVIGFKKPDERLLQFAKTSNPAELVNAYVSPKYRKGKGVGKALVACLEAEVEKRGYSEILINSGPRYKDTGWGFYDKLPGYNRVGISEEHYGKNGDAPVWQKILNTNNI